MAGGAKRAHHRKVEVLVGEKAHAARYPAWGSTMTSCATASAA
jgi:hypothetical protein